MSAENQITIVDMKADVVPPLLLALLGLGANNTLNNVEINPDLRALTVFPVFGTGTIAGDAPAQALFTHHPHHEEREHGREHDREREHHREGQHDEEGIRRPEAGSTNIDIKTKHGMSATTTDNEECPVPPILSCSPKAESTDSCCVVTPGGVLLHTQFWDLGIGQADSWGIHGLWFVKHLFVFKSNCNAQDATS